MTTLSPYGMFGFKVNRPLDQTEKRHHFDTRSPVSSSPRYELALIKLNSTFVESVDKWYSMRGWVAMGMTMFGGFALFAMAALFYVEWQFGDDGSFWLVALPLAMLAVAVYAFTRDAFTYTHYPIRFNRKNRQVYVFRRNGTVLKAEWERIYWTIYSTGWGDLCVMGHLLDTDLETVKESFALSAVTAGDVGVQDLRNHFEFFRRYMQDGPAQVLEAIKPTPLIMLPGIDRQKESWAFGWERLTLNINGFPLAQLAFQVFFLPMSLFRWMVMRTSKIPQWPQWVDEECTIAADDPWVRDGRHRA